MYSYGLGPKARPVYETLRQRIDAGVYAPGEKLPAHLALAREFGVASLTVRQVLAYLEQEGLLSIQQGRGTFVADGLDPSTDRRQPILGERARRKEQELRLRAEASLRRLEASHALTLALAGAVTVTDVAGVSLSHLLSLTGADGAVIVLCDDASGAPEVVGVAGAGREGTVTGRQLPEPVPEIAAGPLRTGRPLWIESAAGEEIDGTLPHTGDRGQAVAVLPLVEAGTVHGCVTLTFGGPRAFDPGEREFLGGLAQQSALAFDRACLYESRARLAALVESSDDAIIATEPDHTITAWNRGAERVYGYSAGEAVGRSISLVVPADRANELDTLLAQLTQGDTVTHFETVRLRKGGTPFDVSLTISPILDRHGTFIGSSTIARDISDTARRQRERERENARLAGLIDIQHAIAEAGLDLDRVMQVTVERLQAITGADRAGIGLLEGDHLVFRAATNMSDRYTRVPSGQPQSSAVRAGRTMTLPHARDAVELENVPREHRPGSLIVAPLQVETEYLGLAYVSWSAEDAFTDADVRSLEVIRALVSHALRHARQYEANQRLLRERSDALAALTESDRRRQESEARYRAMIDNTAVGVALNLPDGQYVEANAAYQAMVGYSLDELRSMTFMEITHPDDLETDLGQFEAVLAGKHDSFQMEKRYLRKDGETVWARLSVSIVRSPCGEALYDLAVIENITPHKLAEQELRRQTLYDTLTGLPNRGLLHDRIQQALFSAHRDAGSFALLLTDLNDFRAVNDTFGHQYGDGLLVEAARRMHGALRETDTVARMGGDEFAVVLPGATELGAILAAEKVVAALAVPFEIDGHRLELGISIGIVLYPAHGGDVATLLRRADVAMYSAKRRRFDYVLYSIEQEEAGAARLVLAADLRRAIAAGELLLHFQPKIDLATGAIDGVEALVRWNHQERGLIQPDEFVGLAEETGLIRLLTLWVVREALRQSREWQDGGLSIPIAVNLSAQSLRDEHITSELLELLAASRLAPSLLSVELTESAVMENRSLALRLLHALETAGIGVSIDDFGTGYSSLAYLRQLPAREIKIDRSFVRGLTPDSSDSHIIHTICELAHSLALRVVAEGVESDDEARLLASLGCDAAQGYYASRPIPGPAVAGLVARHGLLPPPAPRSTTSRRKTAPKDHRRARDQSVG